ERALRGIHRIAGLVVRGASRLELRLQVPGVRVLGLELVKHTGQLGGMALALVPRLPPPEVPEEMGLQLQVGLQLLVARRDRGLRLELLDLRAELEPDVGDARKILARV